MCIGSYQNINDSPHYTRISFFPFVDYFVVVGFCVEGRAIVVNLCGLQF